MGLLKPQGKLKRLCTTGLLKVCFRSVQENKMRVQEPAENTSTVCRV